VIRVDFERSVDVAQGLRQRAFLERLPRGRQLLFDGSRAGGLGLLARRFLRLLARRFSGQAALFVAAFPFLFEAAPLGFLLTRALGRGENPALFLFAPAALILLLAAHFCLPPTFVLLPLALLFLPALFGVSQPLLFVTPALFLFTPESFLVTPQSFLFTLQSFLLAGAEFLSLAQALHFFEPRALRGFRRALTLFFRAALLVLDEAPLLSRRAALFFLGTQAIGFLFPPALGGFFLQSSRVFLAPQFFSDALLPQRFLALPLGRFFPLAALFLAAALFLFDAPAFGFFDAKLRCRGGLCRRTLDAVSQIDAFGIARVQRQRRIDARRRFVESLCRQQNRGRLQRVRDLALSSSGRFGRGAALRQPVTQS